MGNQTTSAADSTSSHSSLEFETWCHSWYIYQFSNSTQKTAECISTEPFVGGKKKTSWKMMLYPRGNSDANKKFVSVIVQSENVWQTRAKIQLTISDNQNRKLSQLGDMETWLDFNYQGQKCYGQALDREVHLPLTDDTLVLTLEVAVSGDRSYTCRMTNEAEILAARQRSRQSLSEDLESARLNGQGDVVIYAGSLSVQRELHAHKMLLSARSPVFKLMLDGNTLEREKKSIILEDTPAPVFDALLQYIYTGETSALPTLTTELLAVADKYEVLGLKRECSALIVSALTAENACAALILADTYNDAKLKEAAFDYIHKHGTAVRATAGFNELLKADQRLLRDLVNYTLGRGGEKPVEPDTQTSPDVKPQGKKK